MKTPPWRTEGQEPDYRFSLANERTYLAWIRTALAVLAGVLFLDQFAVRLDHREILWVVMVLLATMSACIDPAVSAQLKLLKHKPQQGFSF